MKTNEDYRNELTTTMVATNHTVEQKQLRVLLTMAELLLDIRESLHRSELGLGVKESSHVSMNSFPTTAYRPTKK